MSIIPSKKIPEEFFLTEFMIRNTEFRKNSVSTEYGIPHFYGIPYVTECRIFTEFRGIRNSVFRRYGIFAEFRIPYHEFRQKKFCQNFFDGIMDTLEARVDKRGIGDTLKNGPLFENGAAS